MNAPQRRRIGIGGIAIESSTFSPHHATIDDFRIQRGDEMQQMYPYLPQWTWQDRTDLQFIPCMKARSIPGGQVVYDDYQQMKAELLDRIRETLPLDGFFFDVHGAMSVVGMDDAEGDLATAIRELVGDDCIISAGMDLHGNVTAQLVEQVDVFTCYRQAPHIDAMETKERAVRHLVHCLDTNTRPHRAFMTIPVMLPGERTSTFVEPGKTVYGELAESDAVDGVIDPSLWVGYVWADQPRTNATVVVSGTDVNAIYQECRKIGQRYWDARHAFTFGVPAGSADWTIQEALEQDAKAAIISDSGDNPTSGGAGDVPYMVERLLDHDLFRSGEKTAIVAAVPNAAAVQRCLGAGVGGDVTVTIGGVLDPLNGYPFDLSGTVYALLRDDPVGGDIAVVKSGGVHVIIPSRRKPYHHMADFEAVDLRIADHDVTVVKIGYLEPELREAASAAYMALTPGAVNQDIPRLPYQRVSRPIFPLDPDMADPAFPVTIFAPIGAS